MKKIGIIGGIGPASTLDYYTGIIDGYRKKTGSDNYPEIIIYSINMTEMITLIEKDRWDNVTDMLTSTLKRLSNAGADIAVIASNTPHLVFDEISRQSPIPLISIVEETCNFIKAAGYQRVLTIGTLFTMKNGLYTKPLEKCGVSPLLPTEDEQSEIYSLFFPNLENGIVIPEDKEKMLVLVNQIIHNQNADSLLLGCTELPLMIKPGEMKIPVIDTVQIHIASIINHIAA